MINGLFIIVSLFGIAGMLLLPGQQIIPAAVCGGVLGWVTFRFISPRSISKSLLAVFIFYPIFMVVLMMALGLYVGVG